MEERGDEEKLAVSVHRYKNWIDAINARDKRIVELQAEVNACTEQLIYAYLEAREEQEKLIAQGLSRQQIEVIGIIPAVPFDPLVMAKRAKAAGT